MKKLIAIVTFLFVSQVAFSQVFYSQNTKNLRYCGEMTNQVLSLFTADEVQMYYDCVASLGVEKDSMVWVSDSTLNLMRKDPSYYTVKASIKTTEDPTGKIVVDYGYHNIDKPEFMVFVDRYNGVMRITLQMYY